MKQSRSRAKSADFFLNDDFGFLKPKISRVPSGRAVYDKAKYTEGIGQTEITFHDFKHKEYATKKKSKRHQRRTKSMSNRAFLRSVDSKTKIKNNIIASKSAKKYKKNQSIPNKPQNITQIPTNIAVLPEMNETNLSTTSGVRKDKKRKQHRKQTQKTQKSRRKKDTDNCKPLKPNKTNGSGTNMPNNYCAAAFNGIYGLYTSKLIANKENVATPKQLLKTKKSKNKVSNEYGNDCNAEIKKVESKSAKKRKEKKKKKSKTKNDGFGSRNVVISKNNVKKNGFEREHLMVNNNGKNKINLFESDTLHTDDDGSYLSDYYYSHNFNGSKNKQFESQKMDPFSNHNLFITKKDQFEDGNLSISSLQNVENDPFSENNLFINKNNDKKECEPADSTISCSDNNPFSDHNLLINKLNISKLSEGETSKTEKEINPETNNNYDNSLSNENIFVNKNRNKTDGNELQSGNLMISASPYDSNGDKSEGKQNEYNYDNNKTSTDNAKNISEFESKPTNTDQNMDGTELINDGNHNIPFSNSNVIINRICSKERQFESSNLMISAQCKTDNQSVLSLKSDKFAIEKQTISVLNENENESGDKLSDSNLIINKKTDLLPFESMSSNLRKDIEYELKTEEDKYRMEMLTIRQMREKLKKMKSSRDKLQQERLSLNDSEWNVKFPFGFGSFGFNLNWITIQYDEVEYDNDGNVILTVHGQKVKLPQSKVLNAENE